MRLDKFLWATIVVCCSCKAQQENIEKECFKTSWTKWIENKLPKSICVEKDEMVYHLFNDFDFNGDGFSDIGIKTGKKERKNGDIRNFVIYQQVNDSTYTKFKTLNNIYPLWFENYDPTIELKDPELNALKQQYEMGYPLQEIELTGNKIILHLNADVGYKYILTFTFSTAKQDWILTKYVEFDFHNNVKNNYPNDKLNTSISEFSYAKYLNGEY